MSLVSNTGFTMSAASTSHADSAIYNMVGQVFIGQGIGSLGNAGTNIVMPMATILMALTMMVGTGTATYISLNLGQGDPERASRGACNTMRITVMIGIVAAVLLSALWNRSVVSLAPRTGSFHP